MGPACEILMCDIDDPDQCRDYDETNLCTVMLIESFCPHLCNKCPTTTTETTKTSATTTSIALNQPHNNQVVLNQCTQVLNCQNSGIFNNITCKCQCNIL